MKKLTADKLMSKLNLEYNGHRLIDGMDISGQVVAHDSKNSLVEVTIPVQDVCKAPLVLYIKHDLDENNNSEFYITDNEEIIQLLILKYGRSNVDDKINKIYDFNNDYYFGSDNDIHGKADKIEVLNNLLNTIVEKICELFDLFEDEDNSLNTLEFASEEEYKKFCDAMRSNDVFLLMSGKLKTNYDVHDENGRVCMKFTEKREALRHWFMKKNGTLYKLYEDGTEAAVEDVHDILNHDGFIGLEV